jgi:hypothetical protein
MSIIKKITPSMQQAAEKEPRSLVPHSPTLQYKPPKKVAIIGLELKVDFVAQYNPKEVTVEKSLTWNPSPNKKGDLPDLEFASSGGRTLSMELLFDGYEDNVDVAKVYVSKLNLLCSIMKTEGPEEYMRPSMVQVQWPDGSYAPFEGVIQSVSTKYTMFSPEGFPVRATCSIKIAETTRFKDKDGPRASVDGVSPREWRGW